MKQSDVNEDEDTRMTQSSFLSFQFEIKMLTPAFEISQDEIFLTIIIRCPMSKVKDTEIFIEEDQFKFYSKPYYLRLTLPGHIIEDGRESAKYEADTASYRVKVPKLNAGEHFEGLDMITKLLAPKGNSSATGPLIEVIESTSNIEFEDINEEDDIDWQIEQTPYVEESLTTEGYHYGFAHQRSAVFNRLKDEFYEVLDIRDPDSTSYSARSEQRFQDEQQNFDSEHYLADLYETDTIDEVLKYQAPWQMMRDTKSLEVSLNFDEKELMRKLPAKEYLLDKKDEKLVCFGLIDIIFAYAYNHRTTEGENSVESAWTIRKLSATLSWFERFTNLQHVLISSMRRSLCFPLHRNWKLSSQILKDTETILKLGRKYVLKCLLDMHQILCHSESYYILNDLYITDYCVWIQSASKKKLESLTRSLSEIQLNKYELGLNLHEIESVAESVLKDDEDNFTVQFDELSINDQNAPANDEELSELLVETHSEESTDDTDSSDDSDTDSDSTDSVKSESSASSINNQCLDKVTETESNHSQIKQIITTSASDHGNKENASVELLDSQITDSLCVDSVVNKSESCPNNTPKKLIEVIDQSDNF